MATTNSWTPATITKLKSLLERGLSTAEIGKRLGFTKNAIVGKINRLGLNVGTKAKATKTAVAKKSAPKAQPHLKTAKKVTKPTQKKAPEKTKKESHVKPEKVIQNFALLMELRSDQCRWPMGSPDSENFRFCGEKCFAGKPYCFEHCKNAYQFTTPTKKK